jgi:hydroxyacylglutathione hydrolase
LILRRFYDDALAQASYLFGCPATGEALVIDPNRLVDQYLAAAAADGLRITAVTETHIHADFLSGLRELAAHTGATMYLSDAGPPEWRYEFRDAPRVRLLRGGERFTVGSIAIEAVHTPGHTPEHLSFLITDAAAAAEPMGIATGDFVFVGDVGRPDLLEKAAMVRGASEASARILFRSLQAFKRLPDHLQVWPGHGAGSACGKGISAVPQSTVGYERRTNWALAIEDEETFVEQVLAGQPEPPRYFGIMKRMNREGPPLLGKLPAPERLAHGLLSEVVADPAATVVDTRRTAVFAQGHIPGTINVPLGGSFATYAGSLLPYDRDLYFIVDGGQAGVEAVVRQAVSIGLDRVRGYFDPQALDVWATAHGGLARGRQVTPDELASLPTDSRILVDVRGATEWRRERIPGSVLIPLPELPARLDEIPRKSRVVLTCATGSRSAVAASYLRANGYREVANLVGGVVGWAQSGHFVERESC